MKLPNDYQKDFLKHLEYVRQRNQIKNLITSSVFESKAKQKKDAV
jgi:hypothetical protein